MLLSFNFGTKKKALEFTVITPDGISQNIPPNRRACVLSTWLFSISPFYYFYDMDNAIMPYCDNGSFHNVPICYAIQKSLYLYNNNK